MHKNPVKKIVAVVLAMALIVGGLPLLAGKMIKAMAVTNVSSYEQLRDAFAAEGSGSYPANVEVKLEEDIRISDAIAIHSPCTINGNGHQIFVEVTGTDDNDIANRGASNYSVFNIGNDVSGKVTISNLTIKGGSGSVITNAATGVVTLDEVKISNAVITSSNPVISNGASSKMLIKGSSISRNVTSSIMLSNSGTLVLEKTSLNENKIGSAVVNNTGKLYVVNATIAGNISSNTVSMSSALNNTGSGQAYLLDTTVAGNVTRGLTSNGEFVKVVNGLIVDNVIPGDETNHSDIVITQNENNCLLAHTVYGAMTAADTIVLENSQARVDSADNPIFANYCDNMPIIYDDVAYVNNNFDANGTSVYFEYNDDLTNILASYDKNDGQNTSLIESAGISSAKVSDYQTGATRGAILLAGSAPRTGNAYYKVTLQAPKNGKILNASVWGTTVKAGDSVIMVALSNVDYTFLRYLSVNDDNTYTKISTSERFVLTPNNNMTVTANFEKAVSYELTLLLNGSVWSNQNISLYQYGEKQNYSLLCDNISHKYKGTVYTGTYDVYVNGSDSNQDITVTEASTTGSVSYSSLEYDANGGTGSIPSDVFVPTGSAVVLADKGNLAREEYKFTGWTKQGDTTVYPAGSDFTLTSGTKLYANWSPLTINAGVTVKLDGRASDGFNVTLKNVQTGNSYATTYQNGAYTAQVPNDELYTYDIIIDGATVDTVTCNELTNRTYKYFTIVYHGNGNTDGQWNVIDKVIDGSVYSLKENTYVKTGYSFIGWNTLAGGGGTTYAPGNSATINATEDYYAIWKANNYKVTFDVNGGAQLNIADRSRQVDYDTSYGTLPTTTRTGYNFVGWEYNGNIVTKDTVMTVPENHTLKAKWSPVIYDITVPSGSNLAFTLEPKSGAYTAAYDSDYEFTITPKDGYSDNNIEVSVVDTATGGNRVVLTPVDGTYKIAGVDCAKTIFVSGVVDSLAPTGEIEISTSKWTAFLNTITFGKFFKDTQNVTITATDNASGVKSVYYYLSADLLKLNEMGNLADDEWTQLVNGESFSIDPDAKLIVYAKLVDNNNNVAYISSDGIVLDHTNPVISGVVDGEVYTGTQTVTVTDEYLASVTVNGETVTPDANNNVFVTGKTGTQTIIATDKAGNTTTVTITVNRDLDAEDGIVTKELDADESAPVTKLLQDVEVLKRILLNEDDLLAVDAGEDINLLIEINGEEVVPESDKDIIRDQMSDKKIISIFDISVFKEYLTQKTKERVTDTPEMLTFTFDIPSEYLDAPKGKTRTYYLARIHDDQLEYLNDKDTEISTFTADTDKFSTYVLAYKDAEGTTATTNTIEDTTVNEDTSTTTPTDVTGAEESTTTNGNQAGGSGGILTKDNAPVLITTLAVMAAGTATLFTDKKRRQIKKATTKNNK